MGWGCSTVHKHILAGGAGSSLSWEAAGAQRAGPRGGMLGSPRALKRDPLGCCGNRMRLMPVEAGSGFDPSLPLRLLGKEHGSGLLPKVGTRLQSPGGRGSPGPARGRGRGHRASPCRW